MRTSFTLLLLVVTFTLPAQHSTAADAPGCVNDALAAQSAFGATSTCVSAGSDVESSSNVNSSSNVTYSTEPICNRGSGAGSDMYYGCGEQASCGSNGLEYWIWRHTDDGSNIVGATCFESGDAPAADVLTPQRILEAFERIPLPESPLEVQPPGGVTLVNFDTILHTDAQPFTETVQLLNRQITFDIEPAEFTWTLGDGNTLSTTDPGRAPSDSSSPPPGPHAGASPTARGAPSTGPSTSPRPHSSSRSPPLGRSSSPTTEPVLHRSAEIRLAPWSLSATRRIIRT